MGLFSGVVGYQAKKQESNLLNQAANLQAQTARTTDTKTALNYGSQFGAMQETQANAGGFLGAGSNQMQATTSNSLASTTMHQQVAAQQLQNQQIKLMAKTAKYSGIGNLLGGISSGIGSMRSLPRSASMFSGAIGAVSDFGKNIFTLI